MSNIIKNIHSQLKPDKTTKTQLIEQIRNGRVPELKKGSGSAMGAVAAVAVVAVLAGVFALNNAGNKLEKDTASPDNASGITTTVNDPEVTSATTTTSERTSDNFSAEDLKIEFTDISWWNTANNPYVSQEKISISQKMKVILSNREIEWYDNTYTALDSSFENHANANEVGAYIAFGEFTVDGEKHYAAMCQANGYSDQQRIMISLGDNMYYVFENADYDYDDIRMADFTIGNYRIEDFPEAEEISEFDADIILPKVIQKIGNNTGLLSEFDPAPRVIDRIGKKNYTIETVSENDEEYIFDPVAPVPVIMQIYMSGKDYIMLGEVNKIKNTDDLLAVFEGDKKEYRLRFTAYSKNSFILHDNTPAILVASYKGSFKMNIAGDKKEEIKKLLEEISAVAKEYETESEELSEKEISKFTYSLEADGVKYNFYYYNKDTKSYPPEMPQDSDAPNLVINSFPYRIPDEYAQKLSEMAEKIFVPMRSYTLEGNGVEGIKGKIVIDKKQDCDDIYVWLSKLDNNIQKGTPGWEYIDLEPEMIGLDSVKNLMIEDGNDQFYFINPYPENANEITHDGKTYKFNVFAGNGYFMIPYEETENLMQTVKRIYESSSEK